MSSSSPHFTSSPLMSEMSGALRGTPARSVDECLYNTQLGPSTWMDSLASFNMPPQPTVQELYNLQIAIDHEYLRYSRATDHAPPTQRLDIDSLFQLALRLSEPLRQFEHADTAVIRSVQLRSLIAVLTLLQYEGVHALNPRSWDQLSSNIAAHFESIAFQPGSAEDSPLSDRLRHVLAVYLVQLSTQYASYFRRGTSPWISIVTPAFDVLFAGLSLVGTLLYMAAWTNH